MEEYLQQHQSGSSPNLAVQSFSSLLTTQQPSQFLTLLSSPTTTAGHLQNHHPDLQNHHPDLQNLQFVDSHLQYDDYDGDFTNGNDFLFFEYDDDEPPNFQDKTSKLIRRQGKTISSKRVSAIFV